MASGKKNARRQRAVIAFADESGLSQRPPIRSTWAPRGQTPVITHSFTWEKLSMNAALAYRWDGKPIDVYFEVITGSYDQHLLVTFLKRLQSEFPKRRVVLIWDGLPAHKTTVVKNYLAENRRMTVIQLPSYAPDLNPTEFLWGNLKGGELANYIPDSLYDLAVRARKGIDRIRKSPRLLAGFARAATMYF